MLNISTLKIDNLEEGCITDNVAPLISFGLESDKNNTHLQEAVIEVNGWVKSTSSQVAIPYEGEPLIPFTKYVVKVTAKDNFGRSAYAQREFQTGRMEEPWKANWITDTTYSFRGKRCSPAPLTFKTKFKTGKKKLKNAQIFSTAIGIYELEINGKKVGNEYFAPGFTSYKNYLQYQVYNVTELLAEDNEITAVVAGGWAVGKFTISLRNRVYAKRQAFLCELRMEYEDGSVEIVCSDKSWQVARAYKYIEADFYDGETYNAFMSERDTKWVNAGVEKIKIKPQIIASYGFPVRAKERLYPTLITEEETELLYDFGQNFAGVIHAEINAPTGQKIVFCHAEILKDGKLFTKPLRTAKAMATYICAGEKNEVYSPKLTYMGFRYVSVRGISAKDIKLSAYALYSDMPTNGTFECSDPRLNKLQSNILWSAKSNFVDIPTDCPQRDERMGWTGDIAIFAGTAAYSFDTSRFLYKWLKDLKAEQRKTGGIPVTIPHVVFPRNLESVFTMAIDHWGDACILVPWAEYMARGDVGILKEMYPVMQKYIRACLFWAKLFSVGKKRRLWKWGHHYGDWCAYGVGLAQWMGRGKWTATACLANSSALLGRIAVLLGHSEDSLKYQKISKEAAQAYRDILTNGDGKLNKEFMTGYVLPLHYGMFEDKERESAAKNLVKLVKEANYTVLTGFPSTPYLLFALSDNGYSEDAYKMLLSEECPSWLYMVKAGATTIWERWDALKSDGTFNSGDDDGTHGMVSFNHYANGAVGNFFYRRIAGIEAVEAGYKSFVIKPVLGGGLTYASASVKCPYGEIYSKWYIENNKFVINVQVPACTQCSITMPDNTVHTVGSGQYTYNCDM